MKKLIVSLVLLMGLSFNASAGISAAGYAFQPWILPVAVIMLANEAELKACDSEPHRTVMRKGTNFYFDVDECSYQENKSEYK